MRWLQLLKIRKLIFRCTALFILAFPIQAWATPFDSIYVLGDSLSDQGNLFTAVGVPGAPYFNGRFSNGPIYTDLLAQRFGLPLGPSLLGGTNFAFGGARTSYNIAELPPFNVPAGLFPWSLNAETAAFSSRGVHDPNALYIVFSGANDIGDIASLSLNPALVFSNLLNGIQTAVQAFELAGAQTILVPNVPDLGLTPEALSNPIAAQAATALSLQYNALLHAQLAAITGVNIIEFDTFDWFRNVVSNPAAFGLSNVTNPCYSGFILPDPTATVCSNPDSYLFWDREHPTRVGQSLLANQLFAAVTPVSEGSTLPLVFFGLSVLGAIRAYERRKRGVSPNVA